MLDGIELVSRLIAQYAKVEELYLHGDLALHNQVEKCITELYVVILAYLAEAKRYYARRTPGNQCIPYGKTANKLTKRVSPKASFRARRLSRDA
jgi:hypothetical protein